MIEQHMQQCGHDKWGYVVYRTAYESDSDWQDFIVRLHADLARDFESFNGKEIFDKFTLTVMDNKELFDAASTQDIRQHFHEWVKQNYTSEQPQATCKQIEGYALKTRNGSSRYRFAICVDMDSLHSIVQGKREARGIEGWVKVIRSFWAPDPAGELDAYRGPQDPLEGIARYDVRWMKVELGDLITFYQHGTDYDYWDRVYLRLPAILDDL